MAKKKREVDRSEFVEHIRLQIKSAIKSIDQTKSMIQRFQELYDDITRDQMTYNLKYYIIDDGLIYERQGKKKIGF